MQYLVIAYDNANALERRLESRDEHVEGVRKLMAEGKIINAAALIETDEELDAWLENEPYVKNNVWDMDEFQIVPMKVLPKE